MSKSLACSESAAPARAVAALTAANTTTTWPDQWPAGSVYPDYFVIGDLYTNAYEGTASLTDIRLYVAVDGDHGQH